MDERRLTSRANRADGQCRQIFSLTYASGCNSPSSESLSFFNSEIQNPKSHLLTLPIITVRAFLRSRRSDESVRDVSCWMLSIVRRPPDRGRRLRDHLEA